MMIEDLILTIEVTLEEIYHGCVKNKSFMKRVFRNQKRYTIVDTLSITIPKGINNNEYIRYKNKGEERIFDNGILERGDIVVQVIQKQHPIFTRISGEQHLWCEYDMSLKVALTGTNRQVTINQHPAGTGPNKSLIIQLPDDLIIYHEYIHM
jgi:hypothetical protein